MATTKLTEKIASWSEPKWSNHKPTVITSVPYKTDTISLFESRLETLDRTHKSIVSTIFFQNCETDEPDSTGKCAARCNSDDFMLENIEGVPMCVPKLGSETECMKREHDVHGTWVYLRGVRV